MCLFFIIFQLEKLIQKNYFLNLSAKEAFKAYVRAYESHSLKNIFNVQTLDLVNHSAFFTFQFKAKTITYSENLNTGPLNNCTMIWN